MRIHPSHPKSISPGEGERGVVLLLVALLSFSFFAILAWVIDLGFARLSHVQMDVATSAAALEGLRFRDEVTIPNPIERDFQRRSMASYLAGLPFDEDLYSHDLSPYDDALQLGAGPVISMDDGFMGKVHAGRLVQPSPSPVYKPRSSEWTPHSPLALELNIANAPHGDLVTGNLSDAVRIPIENKIYLRNDFTPSAGVDEASHANAFLVRMRRTTDPLGIDRIPGASSSGPPIPFVFGMGTSIQMAHGEAYNPRIDGITVRATSIAQSQPVMTVGRPDPVFQLPGFAPFHIPDDVWNDFGVLPLGVTAIEIDPPTGEIRVAGGGPLVGQFFQTLRAPLHLADTLLPIAVEDGSISKWGTYVPISFPILAEDDLLPRVIGFGSVQLTLTDTSSEPWLANLERLPSGIAETNATANLAGYNLASKAALFLVVMEHYRALVDPLLAPALAR